MCKSYVITNGSEYYKEPEFAFISNRESATQMSIRKAKNVLENSFKADVRQKLYIVEYDNNKSDKKIRTKEDIRDEIKKLELDNQSSQLIKSACFDLINFSLPNNKELRASRETLVDMLSYYDMVRSDIYHIIKEESPQAHIRTKIYGILQEKEQRRSEVKECLRYVDVLIKVERQIEKYKKQLKKSESKSYKGRTVVYDEIMELIG